MPSETHFLRHAPLEHGGSSCPRFKCAKHYNNSGGDTDETRDSLRDNTHSIEAVEETRSRRGAFGLLGERGLPEARERRRTHPPPALWFAFAKQVFLNSGR